MPELNRFDFFSQNESDTETLGAAFGQHLEAGAVIALVGNLGAGKTRFVQAVAVSAGVDRQAVNSPTFVLIQEYEGEIPLYHLDTYRIRDVDEFLELGVEELWSEGGVCFIEWADRFAEVLPRDLLTVAIEITGAETRVFHISESGPISKRMLQNVQQQLEDPLEI